MPVVKLSIAHVAAGLNGHCPRVSLPVPSAPFSVGATMRKKRERGRGVVPPCGGGGRRGEGRCHHEEEEGERGGATVRRKRLEGWCHPEEEERERGEGWCHREEEEGEGEVVQHL